MISGTENLEHVLSIFKNANFVEFCSKSFTEMQNLSNSFNNLLALNPESIDHIIHEERNRNGYHVTLILSMIAPNYFTKNLSKFTLKDFTTIIKDGSQKGQSALWILACHASNNPEPFMSVLNQFKGQFITADFTTSPHDEFDKGTALWNLAFAAFLGKPEALMAVLNQFKDQFNTADFTTCGQDENDNAMSALWFLAGAASNGSPDALMFVLNQHKDQLTAADFTTCEPEGIHKGKSALYFLTLAASKGNPAPLMIVLAHIAFDLQTLNNLSKEKLTEQAQILVITRIYLANLLGSGCTDEESLFSAAKAVKLAGYAKAYYDLGKYFEKMNMQKQAVRSFLELREDSYYVEPICNEYSTRLIGMATEASDSHSKYQHLATALKFALKIENDENRHTTLQTIARIYINQALQNGTDVGSAAIPPHLLEVMHGQLESSWCFKVFQQLAETEQLKRDLKEKSAKLEKSKLKRAREQEQILMPIKELLTHFESEKKQSAEQVKRARPNKAEDNHLLPKLM